MDIKTVKEAKKQCESEIKTILSVFEYQTGCVIYGVNIERIEAMGLPSEVTVNMDIGID